MKIETYIVYFEGGQDLVRRISGQAFSSKEDLKNYLSSEGIYYTDISPMHEFEQNWNDYDEDSPRVRERMEWDLSNSFIAHAFIVR